MSISGFSSIRLDKVLSIMKRHCARTKVNKKIKKLSLTSKTLWLGNRGCNSGIKYMLKRHKQGVMERLYFLLQRVGEFFLVENMGEAHAQIKS